MRPSLWQSFIVAAPLLPYTVVAVNVSTLAAVLKLKAWMSGNGLVRAFCVGGGMVDLFVPESEARNACFSEGDLLNLIFLCGGDVRLISASMETPQGVVYRSFVDFRVCVFRDRELMFEPSEN